MYKKLLLTTFAVVVILAGVSGLIGYVWQKKLVQEVTAPTFNLPTKPDIPGLTELNNSAKIPPAPIIAEPSVVNSYTGQIIELAADRLVISTNYGEKTVRLEQNTLFEKIFVPRFPFLPPMPGPPAEERSTLPEPESISVQDLQSGQQVQVYAENNIRSQEEFTADKISLVIKLNN